MWASRFDYVMRRYTLLFAVTRPETIWLGFKGQMTGFLCDIKAMLRSGA
jgi:hypothetical protein